MSIFIDENLERVLGRTWNKSQREMVLLISTLEDGLTVENIIKLYEKASSDGHNLSIWDLMKLDSPMEVIDLTHFNAYLQNYGHCIEIFSEPFYVDETKWDRNKWEVFLKKNRDVIFKAYEEINSCELDYIGLVSNEFWCVY